MSLKIYNEDLNTLEALAYDHDKYHKLSGQLLLCTAKQGWQYGTVRFMRNLRPSMKFRLTVHKQLKVHDKAPVEQF